MIIDGSSKRFFRRIDLVCGKQLYSALDVFQGFQDQDAQLSLSPYPRPQWNHKQSSRETRGGKVGEIRTPVAPHQNTLSFANSAPRISHAAEPVPRRRVLGEEGTVAQGDRGDRAGKESKNRQLCRGARIQKPQVQFSLNSTLSPTSKEGMKEIVKKRACKTCIYGMCI